MPGFSVNVALDTNLLVYAEGVNGADRQRAALELLRNLPPDRTFLPTQVLGELYAVLVRKARRARAEARRAVLEWGDAFPLVESSPDVLLAATEIATTHQLFIWDAVVVAAAADVRCRLLLSEDLQDGFTWGPLTVANPLADRPHPLLVDLLDRPRVRRPASKRVRRSPKSL